MSTRRAILIVAVVYSPSGWWTPVVAADARVEELVRQLASESFDEREQAAKELVDLGTSVLQALAKASKSKDPEVSRLAKSCIQRIDENAKVVIWKRLERSNPRASRLLHKLQSVDKQERDIAFQGFCELRSELADVMPALVYILDDTDTQIRASAVDVCCCAGPLAEAALPRLLNILEDKSRSDTDEIRMRVMTTLERMGPLGRRGIPILLRILDNDSPKLQERAALSLGKLGKENAQVGPALLKAASKNRDREVQFIAAWSLAQLRKEPAKEVPVIVQILKSQSFKTEEEFSQERRLLFCLWEYGPQAAPAIPYLVDVLKNNTINHRTRLEALKVLIQIGPPAHAVIPGLRDVKDPPSYGTLSEITEQLK